jgi:hypothetical protein
MAHIFENEYAYVTDSHELWLKETSFFGTRKIADIDEMDPEEAVAMYEHAFSQLEERVHSQMEEWHDAGPDASFASKKLELSDEIASFKGIGDFESLLSSLAAFQPAPAEEAAPEPVAEEPAEQSDAIRFYAGLVEKARALLSESNAEQAEHDFQNLKFIWKEKGPQYSSDEGQVYKTLNRQFEAIHEELQHKRSEARDEQSRRRNENLERRKELLAQLESIVSRKKWTAIGEVRTIQTRWEERKNIPHDQVEALENQFSALIRVFEHSRVEFVVKQKQREEENLAGKQLMLTKLKTLAEKLQDSVDNWEPLDAEFNELQNQWRKIGKVPKERENEVWDQFRTLTHAYEDAKIQLNPKYRERLEKNEARKISLCDQAEALLNQEDLALAAREINRLHKDWKQVGPVARDKSETLWQRFKTASDAFNEKKNQNLDVIRELENANQARKEALIAKAEALAAGTDFGGGTRAMEQLLEEWKTVGPVPRRKSQKVWLQFKAAMDLFFKNKRDHFKAQRQVQRDNLTRKKEIVDQIKALLEMEDASAAINEVKKLQDAFGKVGFVPIKYKNKIWKQYQEACDAVYERNRQARKAAGTTQSSGYSQGGPGRRGNDNRGQDDRNGGSEQQRLRKEIEKLKELVLHYSDTMTFIKPNKQGMKLREEIQAKIDEAKKQASEKAAQLEKLNQPAEAPAPAAAPVAEAQPEA